MHTAEDVTNAFRITNDWFQENEDDITETNSKTRSFPANHLPIFSNSEAVYSAFSPEQYEYVRSLRADLDKIIVGKLGNEPKHINERIISLLYTQFAENPNFLDVKTAVEDALIQSFEILHIVNPAHTVTLKYVLEYGGMSGMCLLFDRLAIYNLPNDDSYSQRSILTADTLRQEGEEYRKNKLSSVSQFELNGMKVESQCPFYSTISLILEISGAFIKDIQTSDPALYSRLKESERNLDNYKRYSDEMDNISVKLNDFLQRNLEEL